MTSERTQQPLAERVAIVGGGPGGLFAAILLKRAAPAREVTVYERNSAEETFGFGVVFSNETLGNIEAADPETYARIAAAFSHWDAIDVHYRSEVIRSVGHGFSGLARQTLLRILATRAEELGVQLHFDTEVPDHAVSGGGWVSLDADLIIAADGLGSAIRQARADHFRPTIRAGTNRFTWLGTTRRFDAFTFYFKETEAGLWRVHAYNYDQDRATFIVECTDATWRAAGLEHASEAETAAFCEALFADELEGHPLFTNRSIWRQFPTVTCERWHHENVVLLGDAVHTAHFSIGSGTKLAMEDGIALAEALGQHASLGEALAGYEAERRPVVESTQRAALVSLEWFEQTERYFDRLEPLEFAFSLLTRSMRINHENLRLRDPALTERVDRWFAERAGLTEPVPPMFTPFQLRGLTIPNRIVVSPMCMYSAEDGTVDDWHLVHLGSRAIGGAGLILAEMTDVSATGRISPGCAGMYSPEHVTAWKRIVDFVHRYSEAAIGLQLGHAGRKGATRTLWDGIDQPLDEAYAWPLIAPSAIPWFPHSQVPRPMTASDMSRVIEDHVRAAVYADEAGFDLLEIHFAHGYLLASFLSPLTNHRTDQYGGSLQNRLRFPLEVFEAVRSAWPSHKPISVRISAHDWTAGGNTGDEAVAIARAVTERGCDLIDVSTGQTVPDAHPEYGRLYQTPFSERVRLELGVPTMTVGAISSYGDVNGILAAGRADLCALARAHLFDPYWTRHAAWEQGTRGGPWPKPYSVMSRYRPRMEWTRDPE